MAEPIEFPGMTTTLAAPPGCEDVVQPLPIRRVEGKCLSCWRLTPEELAEIARTGVVWLSIWGSTQPPALVAGEREAVI